MVCALEVDPECRQEQSQALLWSRDSMICIVCPHCPDPFHGTKALARLSVLLEIHPRNSSSEKARTKPAQRHQTQGPDTQKVQKKAIYQDKTQHANFGSNPLYQATKQHLTVKRSKTMKTEMESEDTYLFLVELCCFPVQSNSVSQG